MFVDDGHRASHELVEGPGSSTSARCENWAGWLRSSHWLARSC